MWLDVFKNIAMHEAFLTKLIFREKKGSKVRFLIQDIFTSGQSDCSALLLQYSPNEACIVYVSSVAVQGNKTINHNTKVVHTVQLLLHIKNTIYLVLYFLCWFQSSRFGSYIVLCKAMHDFFSPPTTKFFLHKLKLDTFFWVVSILFSFDLCEWYTKLHGSQIQWILPRRYWFFDFDVGLALPIISLTDWWNLLSLSQDINTIAHV